jgi:hypothetical protein
MAEPKRIKTRIVNKHARETVWEATNNFIPLEGELIVYDKDDTVPYPRMKMGDGSHTVQELPFISAGMAEKLARTVKISLTGDIAGSSNFDGNSDISINAQLTGTFDATYNGKPIRHHHDFEGDEINISIPYTPSGTVSASYQPKGSVSAPKITTTPTSREIEVVTSAGTDGTYTPGQCVFPTLGGSLSGDVLSLAVSGGSYTPGEYIPGTAATKTKINYIESVSVTADAPTFTGTSETITSSFDGTPVTLSTTIKPTGDISEVEITPEGTVEVDYNT